MGARSQESGAAPGPDKGPVPKLCWLDEGELEPVSMQEAREEGRPWLEEADDWIARRRRRLQEEEEREEQEDAGKPVPMDGSCWL